VLHLNLSYCGCPTTFRLAHAKPETFGKVRRFFEPAWCHRVAILKKCRPDSKFIVSFACEVVKTALAIPCCCLRQNPRCVRTEIVSEKSPLSRKTQCLDKWMRTSHDKWMKLKCCGWTWSGGGRCWCRRSLCLHLVSCINTLCGFCCIDILWQKLIYVLKLRYYHE